VDKELESASWPSVVAHTSDGLAILSRNQVESRQSHLTTGLTNFSVNKQGRAPARARARGRACFAALSERCGTEGRRCPPPSEIIDFLREAPVAVPVLGRRDPFEDGYCCCMGMSTLMLFGSDDPNFIVALEPRGSAHIRLLVYTDPGRTPCPLSIYFQSIVQFGLHWCSPGYVYNKGIVYRLLSGSLSRSDRTKPNRRLVLHTRLRETSLPAKLQKV